MKKIIIAIVSVLVLCMPLTACEEQKIYTAEVSSEELSEIQAEPDKSSTVNPKQESQSSVKVPSINSYKVIYIGKLNDYFRELVEYDVPDDSYFELIDIDQDKTPELVISSPTIHDSKCELYTVSGGKLVDLKVDAGFGQLFYNPELKQMATKKINQGKTDLWVGEIEKGKLKTVIKASGDTDAYKFSVNGKEVTEYEFYETVTPYDDIMSSPWVQLGKKHPFEAESITDIVNSYK